ncbi:MAG: hypothetical protein ACFE9T_10670 [Promethearchaeota archaeon]
MLELYTPNYEILNTKDRITIDLLKESQEFLEQLDINSNLLLDTISLIYRYLTKCEKIPHNLFKFLISAYYIVSRHPLAFPLHESKQEFCEKFGLQVSSLEYSVDKISSKLNLIKILDDRNYPYFLDPNSDLGLKFVKNIVETTVEKSMMKFLLYNKPINSQILTEELVSKIIFEENIFPEELFRQFYDIIFQFVEEKFQDYYEYVELQQKYLI